MNDSQLLKCYASRADGHEAAFAELVRRYLNFVYSTGLRLLSLDTHRAEDVAQLVFANLARRADQLPADTVLAGWLHRDTCYKALEILRTERRRRIREAEAMEQHTLDESAAEWERLSPVLDQALNELPDSDRHALLLRFMEERPLKEVGEHLGVGESGASRRVVTALGKLRSVLARHGVTTTASALALATTSPALQAAPPGLAATVTAGSLAAAVASPTPPSLLEALFITMKTKTIVGIAVVVIALGVAGPPAVHRFHQHLAADRAAQAEFLAEQKRHIQPVLPILMNLIQHAGEHGGSFPPTLEEAGVRDQRYEWLGRGVMANSTTPTPILREKAAWQTATGKSARVYGYSDGHAQVQ